MRLNKPFKGYNKCRKVYIIQKLDLATGHHKIVHVTRSKIGAKRWRNDHIDGNELRKYNIFPNELMPISVWTVAQEWETRVRSKKFKPDPRRAKRRTSPTKKEIEETETYDGIRYTNDGRKIDIKTNREISGG